MSPINKGWSNLIKISQWKKVVSQVIFATLWWPTPNKQSVAVVFQRIENQKILKIESNTPTIWWWWSVCRFHEPTLWQTEKKEEKKKFCIESCACNLYGRFYLGFIFPFSSSLSVQYSNMRTVCVCKKNSNW